jgi:hypothetical protein
MSVKRYVNHVVIMQIVCRQVNFGILQFLVCRIHGQLKQRSQANGRVGPNVAEVLELSGNTLARI